MQQRRATACARKMTEDDPPPDDGGGEMAGGVAMGAISACAAPSERGGRGGDKRRRTRLESPKTLGKRRRVRAKTPTLPQSGQTGKASAPTITGSTANHGSVMSQRCATATCWFLKGAMAGAHPYTPRRPSRAVAHQLPRTTDRRCQMHAALGHTQRPCCTAGRRSAAARCSAGRRWRVAPPWPERQRCCCYSCSCR